MKVRKEPESITDIHLKFEGVDRKKKKNMERTSSKVKLSNPGPDWKTKGVEKPQAVHSWRIR